MTLALPSPVSVSLPSPPSRFSMLRSVATATPPMMAVPSAAPFSVAVTAGAGPRTTRCRSRRRRRAGRPRRRRCAPGLSVSSPAPPVSVLALPSPVRLSANAEPEQVLEPAERVDARATGVLRRALQRQADRHAGGGARVGRGVACPRRRPACRCRGRLR